MAAAKGARFSVHLTTDRREAIRDADYVTTQLRVGQMAARADEYLGLRHGLIGQETTGRRRHGQGPAHDPGHPRDRPRRPGAGAPERVAGQLHQPGRSGHPGAQSVRGGAVGRCVQRADQRATRLRRPKSARSSARRSIWASTRLKTLGLNHLTWHHGFTLDGEDVWSAVLNSVLADLRADVHPEWDVRTIEALRMVPNYYLQYFYYTAEKLKAQEAWPPSRAEVVAEVEESLLKQYADPALTEPPADLMKRGGALYSTVATQLLNAHYNDLGETHVVNVANSGAVKDWPASWVLDLPATVRHAAITPQPMPALPSAAFGLIAQDQVVELLTVQAAVHGDRDAAYQALLVHPLGPSADRVQAVLDDLLETHRAYLPQFWA